MEEKFEDTKWVIRSCRSKNDRKHDKQKKDERTNMIYKTQKTKDRLTRTPLKTGDELMCSGD